MKKILIPTKLDQIARELLEKSGDYNVIYDESDQLESLAEKHPDAYALIVRSNKVTQALIDILPDLKVIIRAGAGFNTIDVEYARQKGINVMNTPGANANAVAEEVIALMFADARNVLPADASTRSGKWEKKKFMGKEICNKSIGILGVGAIGCILGKRLKGFDMKILGYDPIVPEECAIECGVQLHESLEIIFQSCDYITLHLPENDKTRGMINAKLFSKMKEGATLINCARSGLINEDDLREWKKKKKIRFLNDVYDKDTEGEKSVTDIADIMLPHLGASTVEANHNAAKRSAEQLLELDETGTSKFIVN